MANILITGASRGIGAALALEWALPGNRLALTARRAEDLEKIAEQVRRRGCPCLCLAGDATDEAQSRQAVERCLAEYGSIDLAILNVGGAPPAATYELSAQAVLEYMQRNYASMIHFFVPLVAAMKAQKRGHIAHVNSLAGLMALPQAGHYAAGKTAAARFLEAARYELRPFGIDITLLYPGFVDTESQAQNPHPKPFMMSPQRAARKMSRAIRRRRRSYAFPWPLAAGIKLLRLLPYPLRAWLLGRTVGSRK